VMNVSAITQRCAVPNRTNETTMIVVASGGTNGGEFIAQLIPVRDGDNDLHRHDLALVLGPQDLGPMMPPDQQTASLAALLQQTRADVH